MKIQQRNVYIVFEQAEFAEDSDIRGVFAVKDNALLLADKIRTPYNRVSVNAYMVEDIAWDDWDEKIKDIS